MRGCNCQDHQPYQSIYCMLNLNETASEAELLHAYEGELARLNQMQPESEAEQILLDSKLQELRCAMEKAKEDPLSQRVQNQYQKCKDHSVRLYSFFPVGFLGIVLRLLDKVLGSGGLIDSVLYRCLDALDSGCCACSCCPDGECCFGDIYGCIFSEGLCDCPSNCADCYENAPAVRLIDMGVAFVVSIGAVLCYLKRRAEAAADQIRRNKKLVTAREDLQDLKELLSQRDEMVSGLLDQYDSLQAFALDVRPFMAFMSTLPGATKKFIDLSRQLEQPGSFYDDVAEEILKLQKRHVEITEIDQRIVRIAEKIQDNEMHQELDDSERCSGYLTQAKNGLRRNYKYQRAVNFLKKNT